MKTPRLLLPVCGLLAIAAGVAIGHARQGGGSATAQQPEVRSGDPFTARDLLSVDDLARLQKSDTKAVLLQVGFHVLYEGAHVPDSAYAGPASRPEGLQSITAALKSVPHDREVVLYCGCCPWGQCPNIRPAFRYVKSLGFTNVRAVYIPESLAKDWVARGFAAVRATR